MIRRVILTAVIALVALGSKSRASESSICQPEPPLQVGTASWYGEPFHGRLTASGEVFDKMALTCAHRTLPLGTWIRVEVQDTGLTVDLKVNDRGPFIGDRVLDLSEGAAETLGVKHQGLARVRIFRLS